MHHVGSGRSGGLWRRRRHPCRCSRGVGGLEAATVRVLARRPRRLLRGLRGRWLLLVLRWRRLWLLRVPSHAPSSSTGVPSSVVLLLLLVVVLLRVRRRVVALRRIAGIALAVRLPGLSWWGVTALRVPVALGLLTVVVVGLTSLRRGIIALGRPVGAIRRWRRLHTGERHGVADSWPAYRQQSHGSR